jgi:hypothetical protein
MDLRSKYTEAYRLVLDRMRTFRNSKDRRGALSEQNIFGKVAAAQEEE